MDSIWIPIVILAVMGALFGALLAFASKKFAVKEDPTLEELKGVLPGANCGGCGFPGCAAYAEAVASKKAKIGLCSVGGNAVSKSMASIMGEDAVEVAPMMAVVMCSGSPDVSKERFEYNGNPDCITASIALPGGTHKMCRQGCLGFGSCAAVCAFGAMQIVDGVAKVDREKCTGCGTCSRTCPKHLIKMVPVYTKVEVLCSNPSRGKEVSALCSSGCIGCGICARNCAASCITMENNLPVVNHELCIGCGICEEKCPTKAIRLLA